MAFKILVVDQFSGLTPYELRQHPKQFDDLVSEVLSAPRRWYRKPELLDVDESWVPPHIGITTIRAGADGRAEIWKCRWDTSG